MNDSNDVLLWERLTLEEVGAASGAGAAAVLPIGATEQHGPHLATGTDTASAALVCHRAAARTRDIVLPALPYGCSLGHGDRWPGTISLHPVTLTSVVVEIGRWVRASGFTRLVMVNGHATNGPPCQSALLQLRYEIADLRMRFVSLFDLSPAIAERYARDVPDYHANEAETSLLLYADPGMVRPDRAVDEPDRTIGRELQYPMPTVTRSGVVGSPSAATAEAGAELLDMLVDALAALLAGIREERDPVL
jgi:creatinine amidohydrolase